MNLLQSRNECTNEGFSVNDFRQTQYDHLRDYIELCVNYLSSQCNNYLRIDEISITKIHDYTSVYPNYLTQIDVRVINENQTKESKRLFKILIPTLVDKTFFILNGNCYVPTLYIVDRPINIKKKSIKISSLFNSISIYDKFVTFMGTNFPASHFLNFFLNDNNYEIELKRAFSNDLKIKLMETPKSDLVRYFSEKFNCDETEEDIVRCFEQLFFDDYTKYLYKYCYELSNDQINIKNIIIKALEQWFKSGSKDFIDLDCKRVVFMEILLLPLFKRIGTYAVQTIRGQLIDQIKIDQLEIIKFFHNKLHNKFIYDSVNSYSGMLSYKASMLNPGSDNAPSIVADLHDTHFQIICPISISNQNPGETVYITPSARFDFIGRFIRRDNYGR